MMRSTFNIGDRIGGVTVSVLTSSVVDREYTAQVGSNQKL